ncbi:DNA polymerase III subunit delta, partial [Patescibacteria group bacterium]
VQKLTEANFDDNIFNLADAVGRSDKALALELINKQLGMGTAPIYLLSMIVRQFRILIQIKEAIGNTNYVNNAVVAKELGLHPFVVQKSMTQVKNYSMEKLKQIYQSLLELDIQLKSSKLSADVLFSRLVISN